MLTKETYMKRCLDIAVLGAGTVSPNPMVGAVIVYKERIIGEGYTAPYGGAHAEVNAVHAVFARYGEEQGRAMLQESVVYVSLEPCAHYGKTPPCADMLVDLKVKQVVIGCLDPYAKVNGLGVAKLKDAGIAVEIGVLEAECKFVNRRFFTRIAQQRPYVLLKWAETADGYFAPNTPEQKWITGPASKQLLHKWRAEEDAILIGVNTALIDKPRLNTREWEGKSPKRVLIDKNLSLPTDSSLYADSKTDLIIFNALKTEWKGHVKRVALENFDLYLPHNILYQLYLMDVQSIIIEGGVKTLDLFIQAGLWDEARVLVGDVNWGEGVAAPRLPGVATAEKDIAKDQLKIFYK